MLTDLDTLRLRFEDSERESEHGFNLHKYGIEYADEATQARWEAWVACRAAMLQGAEPVTTANKLPEGYALIPVEPTYQMCEAMGLPWESPRFPDRYKAMIAAAPQQEVK